MESRFKFLKDEKRVYAIMFLFTGIFVFAFSLILGKNYEALLRNTIVAFIFSGSVIFMQKDARERGKDGFSYDNYYRPERYFVIYMVMVVLSCLFSLIPYEFWPYMALVVIMGLFSNNEIGMLSGIGFITISVMLEANGTYSELFMYVIASVVSLTLLRTLSEDTDISYPVFISVLVQALLLVACSVLFMNRTLSINLFILPILNLMINLVILLLFLNMFGVYVIRKSNDMYMEINDSAYPLLGSLREKSRDEYFRAIHTGYLAERIALGLSFNDRAVKAVSYYHRIGIPDGKNKWEDVEHYYIENNFPEEAVEFLHEYIEPVAGAAKSREMLTVQLSDTLIASIMYLIKKDKNAKIDYDKLIDTLFDKKEKEGNLKEYNVTYREFDEMRKILKKEKLYYDFLR